MLQRDYQKRPSAQALAEDFVTLITMLNPSIEEANIPFPVSEDYMLGADGPLNQAMARWDDIFLPGSYEQHTAMFERYKRISKTRNLLLGHDHPASLWSASRLAWSSLHRAHLAFDDSGDSHELFKDLLTRYERALGEDHLETLAIKQGLALSCPLQSQSISQLQDVLECHTRLLGAHHLDTLWTQGELAWISRDHDHVAEVYQQLEYVLAMRRSLYGPSHRDTLRSIARMAWFYNWTEEYELALKWFEEMVFARKRILGIGHVYTAEGMMGLAFCHYHLGHSPRVTFPALKEASEAVIMVFGPDHIYTCEMRKQLQEFYS